jgi:signal recognition particle subunit SRP54
MFDALTQRFETVFSTLRGKGKLSERDIDAALREVRIALLEADVSVSVVKTFLARVKERSLGEDVAKSMTPGHQVIKIVHEELIDTLGSGSVGLVRTSPPLVILMVGLQGSGKTTTAGKLAKLLKGQGRRPLLVAADLQRPGHRATGDPGPPGRRPGSGRPERQGPQVGEVCIEGSGQHR